MRLRHVIASFASLLVFSAHAKEFRSADVHPDDYPTVTAVKYMADLISKRTNGKHSIKIYSGAQLGSENTTLEQTRTGTLDFLRVNVAPLSNICPDMMVPTMPFLFRSKEHMRKVLDGPIGDEMLRSCERYGVVGLAFYDSGARSLYTVKKPVRAASDVKGMKIRVQQSDLWVAMLQALGANATPMAYGGVYTALKSGLVDGAENNFPSYETSRHFEVAKFHSRTEHSMSPDTLLISKKVWDGLTPEDQKIIREAAKESVPYMRKHWDEKEASAMMAVEKGGAKLLDINKSSFQEAMKPVYEKFITDPRLKDLVRRIQETS